jgi:hypothetical protein
MFNSELSSESEINLNIVSASDNELSEIETTIIPKKVEEKSFVGELVSGISTMFNADPKILEDIDNTNVTADILASTGPGIANGPIDNTMMLGKGAMSGGSLERDISYAEEKYHMYKEAYFLLKEANENK